MLRFLILLALGSVALAALADVYKYTDDKGNVLYTDKPRTLPAQRLDVHSQKTDVVALQQRQEAEQKRAQASAAARDETLDGRNDANKAAQLSATDKAERCAKARERYDTYMNSQKLYEKQPDGERRYLSDEELQSARAASKTTMDAICQ